MKRVPVRTLGKIVRDLILLPFRLLISGGGALIYFPRRYSDIPEYSRWMEAVERIDYRSRHRNQTAYIDVEPGAVPERIWLLFGGNGALALDWLPVISFAPETADGFVLMDYPGYGFSEGCPSPSSIRDSIDDLVRTLISRFDLSEAEFCSRLGVVGHSLGAAIAMDTAARYGAKRVILVSPFTTMKSLAAMIVGSLPSRLLRHHYDNIASIAKWRADRGDDAHVFIFHGLEDELIPLSMAEELADRFPDCVTLQVVEGGDHNGILLKIRDTLLSMIVSPTLTSTLTRTQKD
ncbi:MAG: alpha/beta fold hydrolase [Verrucomicrobiales bacterium]